MSSPSNVRVTVLLPVYNAALYLREALNSIFTQTLSEFELLAIDDGSTDSSSAILESYKDPRLRIVRHAENCGLISSLNEGLDSATGDYIARMDADDISLPRRLERQVRFLDSNPEIGLCGTWARCFDGTSRLLAHPTSADEIRCFLLFDSAFAHPTVMFRAAAVHEFKVRYGNYRHAEDLALWREVADCFPTANIPEVLLNYRVHGHGVTGSSTNRSTAAESLRTSDWELLTKMGRLPSGEELDLHGQMRIGGNLPLGKVENWLITLRDVNRKSGYYPDEVFHLTLAKRWFTACYAAKGWGAVKWKRLTSSPLYDPRVVSAVDLLKFAVRMRH